MLEWLKKDDGHPDHPMRNPASAAKLLAEIREADPLTALNKLSGWLDMLEGIPSHDERVRSEVLSLIQEASGAHLSALLAQFLAKPTGKRGTSESSWKTLNNYLTELTGALYESARVLLKEAATNPSLQLPGAADAARCLHACRMMAKACLVRYLSAPPKLWRLAYAIHDDAEKVACAATPVRIHASHKTTTTVTQELLRLLMLQSSAPEMMAPEQIVVADRVIEQLGDDFTLRPRGVTDNPFCFDSSSDRPPRRAVGQPQDPDTEVRYFGAGTAFDALERLYKQLATFRTAEIKALGALGKDIAPHAQISTLRHLLAFWTATCPYTSPARSPATGELRVIHRYAQVWQHLSRAPSATSELALAEDGDGAPAALETWILQDAGGNELGAEIPQPSSDWARCGNVVGVSMNGNDEYWLGMIRSMHAEWGGCLHANIAILSRDPQTVQLRALIAKGEENVYSEQAAQQFALNRVRAIILSDGSAASQKANLLLPPESWKEGRVYEATVKGSARYLRGVQLLRRGDDYVRATFEWVAQV
jgi:hypothetical protein